MQDAIVLLCVFLAVAYLGKRFLGKKKSSCGCGGGGDGCGSNGGGCGGNCQCHESSQEDDKNCSCSTQNTPKE